MDSAAHEDSRLADAEEAVNDQPTTISSRCSDAEKLTIVEQQQTSLGQVDSIRQAKKPRTEPENVGTMASAVGLPEGDGTWKRYIT